MTRDRCCWFGGVVVVGSDCRGCGTPAAAAVAENTVTGWVYAADEDGGGCGNEGGADAGGNPMGCW